VVHGIAVRTKFKKRHHAAHPGDAEAALAAYEAALFPRSEASATESADSLDNMFGERGLEYMVEFFTAGPAAR